MHVLVYPSVLASAFHVSPAFFRGCWHPFDRTRDLGLMFRTHSISLHLSRKQGPSGGGGGGNDPRAEQVCSWNSSVRECPCFVCVNAWAVMGLSVYGRACVHACVHLSASACACVRACVWVSLCVREGAVRGCVCTHVHVCVPGCLRVSTVCVCVRACALIKVRDHQLYFLSGACAGVCHYPAHARNTVRTRLTKCSRSRTCPSLPYVRELDRQHANEHTCCYLSAPLIHRSGRCWSTSSFSRTRGRQGRLTSGSTSPPMARGCARLATRRSERKGPAIM